MARAALVPYSAPVDEEERRGSCPVNRLYGGFLWGLQGVQIDALLECKGPARDLAGPSVPANR